MKGISFIKFNLKNNIKRNTSDEKKIITEGNLVFQEWRENNRNDKYLDKYNRLFIS